VVEPYIKCLWGNSQNIILEGYFSEMGSGKKKFQFFFFFLHVCDTGDFELGLTLARLRLPPEILHQPFIVGYFLFEIRSQELFALAGFELQSS
jgi:hypothetical protein